MRRFLRPVPIFNFFSLPPLAERAPVLSRSKSDGSPDRRDTLTAASLAGRHWQDSSLQLSSRSPLDRRRPSRAGRAQGSDRCPDTLLPLGCRNKRSTLIRPKPPDLIETALRSGPSRPSSRVSSSSVRRLALFPSFPPASATRNAFCGSTANPRKCPGSGCSRHFLTHFLHLIRGTRAGTDNAITGRWLCPPQNCSPAFCKCTPRPYVAHLSVKTGVSFRFSSSNLYSHVLVLSVLFF